MPNRMNIEEDIKTVNKMIEKSNIEDTDMNDILQTREIEAIENILAEYKRVKEENERLTKNNFKLNLEIENRRKEYQETYKDIREELKELKAKANKYDALVENVKNEIKELEVPILIYGGRGNGRTYARAEKEAKKIYLETYFGTTRRGGSLTEEEKKVIDIIKYNDIARPLACGDVTICNVEDLKVALNLIQRQQEENIKLKQENENLKNREKHQSKEIKKAVDYTFELNAEIEKKDKAIDAMAKQLYIEGYCKEINCKKCNAENFANCIKQYFERKAEDENNKLVNNR